MNKLLTTTAVAAALALSSSASMAASDISQILAATQNALNNYDVIGNSINIDQSAVNAGNLVNSDQTLASVTQSTSATQNATNNAQSFWGYFTDLTQSATNVVDSISIEGSVDGISQSASGPQAARNWVQFNQWYDGADGYDPDSTAADPVAPAQSAVNAANLVTMDLGNVNYSATQTTSSGATQSAVNQIVDRDGAGGGPVRDANQVATNVANSVVGDVVNQLTQSANANQTASNELQFSYLPAGSWEETQNPRFSHDLLNSSQAATNVANVATLDSLGSGGANQASNMAQSATNSATYAGAGAPSNAPSVGHGGNANDFDQTAINAANLLTVASLYSAVSQSSYGSQYSSNNFVTPGGYGVTNITQTATNVANSINNVVPTP